MKNLILFLLIALFAISCNKRKTVVVSGKITNPVDELTGLFISYLDKRDTIPVAADGAFFSEFDLDKEHLAWFGHGNYSVPLYLVPGAQINLEFDATDFEGWIYSNAKITGDNSEGSAFLYALDKNLKKPSSEELSRMKVDSFATIMKNLEQNTSVDIEKFITNHSPSKLFTERIQWKQKVELAMKYLDFIKYHQYYNPYDKPVPSYFQKYIDAIPENNENMSKEITEYHYFLFQNNEKIFNDKMKASRLEKETVAYINKMADEIIDLNTLQSIKDDIGRRHFSVFYKRPDSLRKVYISRFYDVVKNEEYVNDFNEVVAAIERTRPGSVAPSFNYPDINGNMVSLESFKGKVVYVDVWATWCGPCKSQFPYQKKLEADLQGEDIVFVNISVDDDKDREVWEKMVKQKELGGYQLFANGVWEEKKIVKDYGIRGIPYYIIIDKEGKLVEVFASWPSDQETKEKLIKLAKS